MKPSELVLCIGVVSLLSLQILVPFTSAHTGEKFLIIIKENGSVPGNPPILVNDTAWWVNVDNRTNVTHQILVDMNSDGIYDSDKDLISKNLTYEGNCKSDNGTRLDNCEADFSVTFNETVMNMSYNDVVGTYAFMDIDSNGVIFYGNITVSPELHVTAGFQDNFEAEETDDTKEEKPAFLLMIAGLSGTGALILGVMVLFGKKDE